MKIVSFVREYRVNTHVGISMQKFWPKTFIEIVMLSGLKKQTARFGFPV